MWAIIDLMQWTLDKLQFDNTYRYDAGCEITFDTTVTSIVGPNGSGKSSIIDIISVLMYGRPLRGGVGDIVNHMHYDARIRGYFTIMSQPQSTVCITRLFAQRCTVAELETQNGTIINGITEVNNYTERLFGSFEQFRAISVNCIFDMTPLETHRLFSSIYNTIDIKAEKTAAKRELASVDARLASAASALQCNPDKLQRAIDTAEAELATLNVTKRVKMDRRPLFQQSNHIIVPANPVNLAQHQLKITQLQRSKSNSQFLLNNEPPALPIYASMPHSEIRALLDKPLAHMEPPDTKLPPKPAKLQTAAAQVAISQLTTLQSLEYDPMCQSCTETADFINNSLISARAELEYINEHNRNAAAQLEHYNAIAAQHTQYAEYTAAVTQRERLQKMLKLRCPLLKQADAQWAKQAAKRAELESQIHTLIGEYNYHITQHNIQCDMNNAEVNEDNVKRANILQTDILRNKAQLALVKSLSADLSKLRERQASLTAKLAELATAKSLADKMAICVESANRLIAPLTISVDLSKNIEFRINGTPSELASTAQRFIASLALKMEICKLAGLIIIDDTLDNCDQAHLLICTNMLNNSKVRILTLGHKPIQSIHSTIQYVTANLTSKIGNRATPPSPYIQQSDGNYKCGICNVIVLPAKRQCHLLSHK